MIFLPLLAASDVGMYMYSNNLPKYFSYKLVAAFIEQTCDASSPSTKSFLPLLWSAVEEQTKGWPQIQMRVLRRHKFPRRGKFASSATNSYYMLTSAVIEWRDRRRASHRDGIPTTVCSPGCAYRHAVCRGGSLLLDLHKESAAGHRSTVELPSISR